MDGTIEVQCPYCGEIVGVDVDEGGSSRQQYVEDCPVCCRPWRVDVRRDGDGAWSVDLRTEDD
jgi:Cysteine-rich CPXCG